MKMSFKEFEKNAKKQADEQRVIDLLNNQVNVLKKRRDDYALKAKIELKKGNQAQYKAMVALLKYSMFNLSQAESMLANFTIAKEMSEMQTISKGFTKSLNTVMKDVAKVSKAINAAKTEKLFTQAVNIANQTAMELKEVLKNNNAAFEESVNSLSEISDEEISKMIGEDVKTDEMNIDSVLESLERELNADEDKA